MYLRKDFFGLEQLRRETLPILETLRAKIKAAEDLVASHSSSSSLLGFRQQVEQLRADFEALTVKNIIGHNDKEQEEPLLILLQMLVGLILGLLLQQSYKGF
nr:basic leucine zipper 9 [Tanacetum cinerariifolium]